MRHAIFMQAVSSAAFVEEQGENNILLKAEAIRSGVVLKGPLFFSPGRVKARAEIQDRT